MKGITVRLLSENIRLTGYTGLLLVKLRRLDTLRPVVFPSYTSLVSGVVVTGDGHTSLNNHRWGKVCPLKTNRLYYL